MRQWLWTLEFRNVNILCFNISCVNILIFHLITQPDLVLEQLSIENKKKLSLMKYLNIGKLFFEYQTYSCLTMGRIQQYF